MADGVPLNKMDADDLRKNRDTYVELAAEYLIYSPQVALACLAFADRLDTMMAEAKPKPLPERGLADHYGQPPHDEPPRR